MPISCSIVISAFNEEKTVGMVFQEALAVLKECGGDFEIILCDDTSSDGTKEVIASLVRQDPRARAIYHTTNQGMFKTFEELYRSATKDYVLLLPGDGQWHANLLVQALEKVGTCDVIVAARRQKKYTWFRHLNSWFFNRLVRILFGVELYDIGSVKLFRSEVLAKVRVETLSAFTEAERLLKAHCLGYRIGHIVVDHRARVDGIGRGASAENISNAIKDMIRFRFNQWPMLVKQSRL